MLGPTVNTYKANEVEMVIDAVSCDEHDPCICSENNKNKYQGSHCPYNAHLAVGIPCTNHVGDYMMNLMRVEYLGALGVKVRC